MKRKSSLPPTVALDILPTLVSKVISIIRWTSQQIQGISKVQTHKGEGKGEGKREKVIVQPRKTEPKIWSQLRKKALGTNYHFGKLHYSLLLLFSWTVWKWDQTVLPAFRTSAGLNLALGGLCCMSGGWCVFDINIKLCLCCTLILQQVWKFFS